MQSKFQTYGFAVVTLTCLFPWSGHTCGPWFPETLMRTPHAAMLPPTPSFEIELETIELDIKLPGNLTIPGQIPPRAPYDPVKPNQLPGNELAQSLSPQELIANASGCREQLKQSGSELAREVAELAEILASEVEGKGTIANKSAETTLLEYRHIREAMFGLNNDPVLPPIIKRREWPAGIPNEFSLYLNAAADFREKNFGAAKKSLTTLLNLPPEQRRHRSIWAEFLMGRILLAEGDDGLVRSIVNFRRILDLYTQGFYDSLGMRWDALKCIADHERFKSDHDPGKIIKLYFALARTGHPYCLKQLKSLVKNCDYNIAAKDPVLRQIVTAFHLTNRSELRYWQPGQTPENEDDEVGWLSALERAQVTTREANRLAWLAYKAGHYQSAQRWLKLASQKDEIGHWVAAKLALRDDSTSKANQHLTKAESAFQRSPDYSAQHQRIESHGYTNHQDRREDQYSQFWGDLALVRLANNEFVEALDALIRSGYWYDAAFVAEQLLSRDELLSYVRKHYPTALPEPERPENYHFRQEKRIQNRLRYLTARRLARDHYFKDAHPLFPKELQPVFSHYVKKFREFRKGNELPIDKRAASGWETAQIHRDLGMELFGTEVGPDWFCLFEGNFSDQAFSRLRYDLSPDQRRNEPRAGRYRNPVITSAKESEWNTDSLYQSGEQLEPTPAEQWRFRRYAKLPNPYRFHYRHVAADLAWEASLLHPGNTDQHAEILNTAGRWLAYSHPKQADVFYKALVNRNRNTILGLEADERRWFPVTSWNFDAWKAAGVQRPE